MAALGHFVAALGPSIVGELVCFGHLPPPLPRASSEDEGGLGSEGGREVETANFHIGLELRWGLDGQREDVISEVPSCD